MCGCSIDSYGVLQQLRSAGVSRRGEIPTSESPPQPRRSVQATDRGDLVRNCHPHVAAGQFSSVESIPTLLQLVHGCRGDSGSYRKLLPCDVGTTGQELQLKQQHQSVGAGGEQRPRAVSNVIEDDSCETLHYITLHYINTLRLAKSYVDAILYLHFGALV